MPVTVLCDAGDTSALWAIAALQERGIAVDVVTAAALAAATRWEHRIEGTEVRTSVALPDGRVLASDTQDAVLNRLSYVPTGRIDRVAGADRDYAVQELNALFLSWLSGLPGRVVNRPTPQGLGGNMRHPSAWRALGREAGLPVATWAQSQDDDPDRLWLPRDDVLTVHAVGPRIVAPDGFPAHIAAGCRALARRAGETLLGIDFAARADGSTWELVGASPLPDLVRGGEALADALAALLA